jgi:anti-sigma regulatory factor (Ser/Thr protein kinase)
MTSRIDCILATCRTQPCSHARLAASGCYGQPVVSAADVARVPPLTVEWPYRTFLELGAFPSAVPCARLHTRHLLWEWGLAKFSESTELLVAELTTNAIQVSRAAMQDDPIRLWLASDKMQVVILVWDASLLPPVPMDVGDDVEGGRGLLLVKALSTRWNWYIPHRLGGKVIWAQIDAEPTTGCPEGSGSKPADHDAMSSTGGRGSSASCG